MLDYDLTRSTFRYVESLWFGYNDMIDRLSDIEIEERRLGFSSENTKKRRSKAARGLTSGIVESADAAEECYISDSASATKKQKRVIERNVKAIDTVYKNLPDEYKKVADIRYFKRRNRYNKQAPSWEEVSKHSNYSRRHAMRIRDKIVRDTAMLLGLW